MTDRENFAEILDEYLRALGAGNAPDREALLAAHPDLAGELQAALLGIDFVHGAAPRLAPEEHTDAQPGKSLGDYRLLRELGRGGMAVVYEAEQVSLGRRVALKVLPFAAVLDSKHLQRFKNEAMAAAHLRHPNIVPVYGVGCERGVHYYAMQYVEGQSLAAAIRDLKGGGAGEGARTPISSHGSNREPAYIRMAAALGVQAAEALDHAHEFGIVHRDVKPGNLLVDQAGTLWITDFGLAHSKKDVGLTITGELLGTIRYMSPEQALAKRVPIDHRTDVYSLGATLYELFTLEPAFPGDDPHLVIQDIAFREPVAPRRLNPALPRDLETVILKAMSKDPRGRYATAQEMADDLGRFLEDRPIEAKRPGFFRRAAQWGRRHRALVGAAAGMLLLAVAGLATGMGLLLHEQGRTTAALKDAKSNLLLARNAVDKFLIEGCMAQFRDAPLPTGAKKQLLEAALRFYEIYGEDRATSHRAGILHDLHRYADALAAVDRDLQSRPRDAKALTARGHMLFHLGRYDEALVALDSALAIDPAVGPVGPHVYRGHVLASMGRLADALAAHREAVRIHPSDPYARQGLGKTLHETGHKEDAVREWREAVRLDPDDATVRGNLGVGLKGVGDVDGAIREYREAIRLNPDFAAAHYNLGNALRDTGDLAGAMREWHEAIRLDPDDAGPHARLGNALSETGDMEGAIQEYGNAIRLRPTDADGHRGLGDALAATGDVDGAIREYREAIRLQPGDAVAHNNLGLALSDAGDLDGAIRAYHEALRLEPHAATHNNLGNALRAKGEIDAAVAQYRVAIGLDPNFADGHYGLGCVLCDDKRDHDGAIQEFSEAIRLRPDFADAHYNLGVALRGKGDPDAAITSHREAIRLKPDDAVAHRGLGRALEANGDLDGAIGAYREAIRLKPEDVGAHNNLGNALADKGELDAAIDAYREAIRLAPDLAEAHYNLGNALAANRDLDGAIGAYREAIRLKPEDAGAHNNLGNQLADKGELDAAIDAYREAIRLAPDLAEAHSNLNNAERQAEMEGRLEAVLSGEAHPRDAVERVAFAGLLYARSRYAESARMWAQAFAEDAGLAGDLAQGHRYNAACSASLAAAHGGADAAEWRGRALEWLRADLAAHEKAASRLVATLKHWKQDPDLAAVRDRLDELPEPEREAWRTLWAAVDRTLTAARPAAN